MGAKWKKRKEVRAILHKAKVNINSMGEILALQRHVHTDTLKPPIIWWCCCMSQTRTMQSERKKRDRDSKSKDYKWSEGQIEIKRNYECSMASARSKNHVLFCFIRFIVRYYCYYYWEIHYYGILRTKEK